QWFVRMRELAAPAIAAVDSNKVQFIPKRWENVYFDWMENTKDWCISRQLWWGHQIPVWYCESCEETIVSREDPTCCPRCESKKLAQDPDVLDTWFSSALFPFSVMGWPEKTPELEYFYPTSLLITGFDIIFFWVARMIMMGIHFVDKVPFRQVYITPLVEDEHGIKMSSSRGNTIDPLEVKRVYGMDALRFTLAQSSSKGRGMRLEVRDIEASRNFLNKIWNMARFVLMNLDDERPQLPESVNELEDRFLLSRLAETIQLVRNNIESYNFNLASEELFAFIWHDFCDWYLELAKVRLMSREDHTVKAVLYHVLRTVVKLLHPFVPFISEEIWHVLGEKPTSVSITSFPKATARDENAEAEMSVFKELVSAARMIRSELNVPQEASIEVLIKTDSVKVIDLVNQKTRALRALVCARAIRISDDLVPPAGAARKVLSVAEVFIPLKGLIDVDAERARLSEEVAQMVASLKKVERNLANETFLGQAPEVVIAKERAKQDEFSSRLSRLRENLTAIGP
ncbi:class I tRNA ligase family protein, partial [Candidatus Bipolaricaulota bacterium]|nr:class I tRNA ligase family protein [Candidatus Bipolaricaulota bacterium]